MLQLNLYLLAECPPKNFCNDSLAIFTTHWNQSRLGHVELSMSASIASRPFFSVRIFFRTSLFLLLLTAASCAAHAQTIPCATDSQGNAVSFNTEGNPYFCTITTTVNPDGSEDVRIDQPNVNQPSFEYKQIIFKPSDLVTITADGCAQTAGIGATWKKYVNPVGSQSGPTVPDGLYYGTIQIKGATTANGILVPGDPLYFLTVPIVNPPTQIFIPSIQTFPGSSNIDLILGYVDDNYDDHGGNGYWGHDNGNDDQCANTDPNAPLGSYGGPAFINLHIVHNAANPFGNTVPKDWDLTPNGLDANGLPINPEWGWQVNGGFITNQGVYNAGCFPGCASQFTSYDLPSFSGFDAVTHWLANVCNSRTGTTGHHDWFDATYTGSVFWITHDGPTFGDDDYNMRLVTPTFHTDPASTTFFNGGSFNDGAEVDIGLEFDSDETIDHFDQSLFWNVFHQTVDNQGDDAAGNIINGHDAVVTGLVGIDEVHSGYSEVHPVHVLAIRESAPGSPNMSNDYWAFFVRNWGDEGECSSQQHYLLDNQVTIQLSPPIPQFTPPNATLNADTQVYGTGTDGTFGFFSGPEGTFVTFNLPPGNQSGFAFGEIDINWNTGQAKARPRSSSQMAADHRAWLRSLVRSAGNKSFNHARLIVPVAWPSPPPPADPIEGPGEPEILLANIFSNLSAAQQQTYTNLLNTLSTAPPPIVSSSLQVQLLTTAPQRPPSVPGVATAPATAKLQRDGAQGQALCSATGGNLPTQPAWCANTIFPPVTTLTTSGGTPVIIGWYTTPVTATLTAYDASGSGTAFTQYGFDGQTWTTYAGPFVLPDGLYTFYYRSQDNKGNLEQTRQQSFQIDTVPPLITITQPAAGNYTHSSTLTLSYNVTDGPTSGLGAGSGVASVTPTMDGAATLAGHGLASGKAINLLTEMSLGLHTFTVQAVDNVGHTSSQAITFSIIVTPDSIIADVNEFLAAGKIAQNHAQSLLAKLEAAKDKRAAADCTTASNIYQAFINEVQAQSGKHIDPTAASIMIGDAQYLITNCP